MNDNERLLHMTERIRQHGLTDNTRSEIRAAHKSLTTPATATKTEAPAAAHEPENPSQAARQRMIENANGKRVSGSAQEARAAMLQRTNRGSGQYSEYLNYGTYAIDAIPKGDFRRN